MDPKETGEVMMAYAMDGDDNETEDLTKLTLDQLRKLCKNIGKRYVNNCTKFQCRKALCVLANYQEHRERDGTGTISDKTTGNIIRITNIIFSHEFLDSFLALNDSKKRTDHETGELPKNFWEDVLEAMNGSDDDDDDTALQIVIAQEDEHYEEIKSVKLQEFDIMSSSAIKKKVNQLLKVRKQIQKNMTISGEHDSNPYNFVEVAMNSIGKNGLSLLGCYYFFKRCEDTQK